MISYAPRDLSTYRERTKSELRPLRLSKVLIARELMLHSLSTCEAWAGVGDRRQGLNVNGADEAN